VKSKILYISLVMVLAMSLAVGAIGCGDGGDPSNDTVVIGMSRSITGGLSTIHNAAFGPIYKIYTDMVNDPGYGGIDIDGTKFPMAYVEKNDNSEDSKLIAHTLDLISDVAAGDVHTIFGPTCTRMIDVMAPYCNNNDCVLLTAEGGATFLEEPGYLPDWPYVFINLSFSDWCQLQCLAPLLSDAHGNHTTYVNNATAFIYWQNDAHGEEYLASAEAMFPPYITILGDESVLDITSGNPTDYDYMSAIDLAYTAYNGNPVDIVCCFCYPAEVIGLTVAAIAKNYNFNAWVGGPGANFGFYGLAMQANAEDVMCFAIANNKTSADMKWLFDTMIMPNMDGVGGYPGFYYLDWWGQPLYWAALQVWEEAIGEVGVVTAGPPATFVVSQVDLKNELHSYDGSPDSVPTILGDTYYDFFGTGGGILSCDCHTGEIGQWQTDTNPYCSLYVEIVGCTNETASINYPKTSWAGFP